MRSSCSAGSTWMSDARVLHRLQDHQVHELDDGRVLDDGPQAGQVRDGIRAVVGDDLGDRGHLLVQLALLVEQVAQLTIGDAHSGKGLAENGAEIVDRGQVGRIEHGHHEATGVTAQRERSVAPRQLLRDESDDGGLGSLVTEVEQVAARVERPSQRGCASAAGEAARAVAGAVPGAVATHTAF